MTIMTEETHTSQSPEPTLATIARLVEQTIVEGQETRARVDAQGQIMNLRFDGFQKQLDAAEDRSKAEFLMLTGDIADVRKHLARWRSTSACSRGRPPSMTSGSTRMTSGSTGSIADSTGSIPDSTGSIPGSMN